MVKDKREDFNYFGMKPIEPGKALFFCIFAAIAILATILIVPALLNDTDKVIQPDILFIVYLVVLEVLFVGVCLLTKFELSLKNVIAIKIVLLPFALVLSPVLLLLYITIKYNFREIIDLILGVLKAIGLTAVIIICVAMVLAFFIAFNMEIAEVLGQKPKGKK